jgi:sugar phosphate isomerase/epimerase
MSKRTFSRRDFMQQGAVLLGGAIAAPSVLSAFATDFSGIKRAKHIGMQLYSVRDAVKKDPKGTLQQLAAMGYKELEPAAYIYPEAYSKRLIYGNSPKEFRKMTDDLGMKTPSSHVVFSMKHWDSAKNDMVDTWKQVVEDALIMGQKYLISPSFDADKTNLDACKRGIEIYNKVGMLTAKAGLRFGFHNHHQEFTQKFNDEYLYDIMLKGFDLKYVCQQLDIGNMTAAKVDPMRWLKMFPKHFELMHVKDSEGTKFESTTLGDGILKLDEILSFAKANTKIKYWVLEQESYGDKTPFECMKIDLDRFKGQYKFG